MKKIAYILIFVTAITAYSCQQSNKEAIHQSIVNQLDAYPKSTLQDIYKYFYQEHFGPEHAISDTNSVKKHLVSELSLVKGSNKYYEPIGMKGEYVRVYLNTVTDGLISAEDLLNAFIASANEHRTPSSNWKRKWGTIVSIIKDENIKIKGLEDNSMLTEAARKDQAVHHSKAYNEAYHPHYRIVSRSIFERDLKPMIEQ